jgi:hypothetical protein
MVVLAVHHVAIMDGHALLGAGILPSETYGERGGGTKHQIHIHRLLETKVPPRLSCSVPSRSWCGGLCTDGVSTLLPGESARAPASLVIFRRLGKDEGMIFC